MLSQADVRRRQWFSVGRCPSFVGSCSRGESPNLVLGLAPEGSAMTSTRGTPRDLLGSIGLMTLHS